MVSEVSQRDAFGRTMTMKFKIKRYVLANYFSFLYISSIKQFMFLLTNFTKE